MQTYQQSCEFQECVTVCIMVEIRSLVCIKNNNFSLG